VKFGDKLESIGKGAFGNCTSLERIAIPLKDGMINDHADEFYSDVFRGCKNLKHVDLVGEVHETIAALHLEDWRNDMNAAIDDIFRILLHTPVYDAQFPIPLMLVRFRDGKGWAVQRWI
jgi:hypothetical protein